MLDERPHEPMPREWVLLASFGSLFCAVVGLFSWGSDLIANVVANLVLLGPGLLLTNVVAGEWHRRRQEDLFRRAISVHIEQLALMMHRSALRSRSAMHQILLRPMTDSLVNVIAPGTEDVLTLLGELHRAFASMVSPPGSGGGGGETELLRRAGWLPIDRPTLHEMRIQLARLQALSPFRECEGILRSIELAVNAGPGDELANIPTSERVGRLPAELSSYEIHVLRTIDHLQQFIEAVARERLDDLAN